MNKKELVPGVWVHCIDAPICHGPKGEILEDANVGTLGLLVTDLRQHASRGHSTAIAQFYGLLNSGLILTQHIFRGLQRPLLTAGDNGADKNKLIYSRKPSFDYRWSGTGTTGSLEQIEAPKSAVFVVFVSPNTRHRERFPSIDGWINHWTWIDEDDVLPQAPVGWVDRFEDKVWTRK